MQWNWEQNNWPEFIYDDSVLRPLEEHFTHKSGMLCGICKHLNDDDQNIIRVNLLSEEALKTSEIEGVYLDRASIQSSIRRHFGLQFDRNRIGPAEHGISTMMLDLYDTFAQPLTHETLWNWQGLLCEGREDLNNVGCYRTHNDPMRVVSGPIYDPKIHFVAPPSSSVKAEMNQYITWFNASAPPKSPLSHTHTPNLPRRSREARRRAHLHTPLPPPLTRAGIAHLHFVSIHPFEDGNGRLARALAEKALAQAMGHPTLIALAQTINKGRKLYYHALECGNKTLDITDWLAYFAQTILTAQDTALQLIEFVITKGKFLANFENQINQRQLKVVIRMFAEGPDGFKGGLSAANYMAITRTSSATTRDLKDLVTKGALSSTGQLKHTRYHLNLQ